MAYQVNIRQWNVPVAVEMGQTILEAALEQGVPFPHGCRSGNCGACKSRHFGGEVEMAAVSEYALTDAERADGLILACRATPWEDAEIAWLEADEVVIHPLRNMGCRVVGLDLVTHDIRRVRLEILTGGPFSFSAGQYARLTVPGLPPRDYSMANRPDDPLLEFHIRAVPGGVTSSYVLGDLKLGDSVMVEGPFGTSYWREQHRGPILALAGGSGLAPIKSIVETALAAGADQPIHLYFGVRDERDLYAEAEMAELASAHHNFQFIPVLSMPSGETARRTGFLHDAVARDLAELDGAKVYLAGPPVMVEAAVGMLADLGVRREDIHADAFYTEADKAKLEVGG